MLVNEIIDFETEIADIYNAGKIRAMIHLHDDDGLDELVQIFKHIRKQDWVLCSWRSHAQCLLKGVPKEDLKAAIMAGKSIALCFPEYRVYSSGIVGGMLPIATGLAEGIKRQGKDERVYCFLGDMTAETGIAHETIKYSRNHELPIQFIIEDNGKSVCTDTNKVWAQEESSRNGQDDDYLYYFSYRMNKYPHSGAGVRVEF